MIRILEECLQSQGTRRITDGTVDLIDISLIGISGSIGEGQRNVTQLIAVIRIAFQHIKVITFGNGKRTRMGSLLERVVRTVELAVTNSPSASVFVSIFPAKGATIFVSLTFTWELVTRAWYALTLAWACSSAVLYWSAVCLKQLLLRKGSGNGLHHAGHWQGKPGHWLDWPEH